MDWQDLLTAFALYLILEGIFPFVSPAWCKRLMIKMSGMKDMTMRGIGIACMLAGAVLLYFVR